MLNAARRCETTWPVTLKFRSDGALVAMTQVVFGEPGQLGGFAAVGLPPGHGI